MIEAKIAAISSHEGLSFVTFSNETQSFYMLATSLDENIKEVILAFKPSDVVLSSKKLICSASNEIKATLSSIDKGDIVSMCLLKSPFCSFEALIASPDLARLDLKQGAEVYAYIKATSLYIKEIKC